MSHVCQKVGTRVACAMETACTTRVVDKRTMTSESMLENGWYSIWKKPLYIDTTTPLKDVRTKCNGNMTPTSPCRTPPVLCEMV